MDADGRRWIVHLLRVVNWPEKRPVVPRSVSFVDILFAYPPNSQRDGLPSANAQ